MLAGQRQPRRQHVVVHLLDPCDEPIQVARPAGLGDAIDGDAGTFFGGQRAHRRTAFSCTAGPAREDIDCQPAASQRLGELAHVPRQATLDHGGVLP